jgi:hypothetical protein
LEFLALHHIALHRIATRRATPWVTTFMMRRPLLPQLFAKGLARLRLTSSALCRATYHQLAFCTLHNHQLQPFAALDSIAIQFTNMAPTKKDEKEAKLTPEQSAAMVLDYLRKQNRPYSATDISANLKNRVTKTAAAKLLKDLHERNEIEGRAAGKQLVYHSIQVRRGSQACCVI